MPSTRSGCVVPNHSTSPYSWASVARRSGSFRARRTASSVTASAVGGSVPRCPAVSRAASSGRPRSASTIWATVGWANATSIHSSSPVRVPGAGSVATAWIALSRSTLSSSADSRPSSRTLGTWWSARPAAMASAGPTVLPVSARYSPTRPGARPSSQDPPTSGVKPIRVSGIASIDRSVTMRCEAWPARPIPPPIVIPSANATIGCRYSAIRALRAYSARKKASTCSG